MLGSLCVTSFLVYCYLLAEPERCSSASCMGTAQSLRIECLFGPQYVWCLCIADGFGYNRA